MHNPRSFPFPLDPSIDELSYRNLIQPSAPATHDSHGSVSAPTTCCRADRSQATDARLTRLADPLSHGSSAQYTEDRPAILRVSLDEGARLPTRAFPTDAGLDLWPLEDTLPRLMPHETRTFDTGVHVEIPPGYVGIIATRSGMAKRSIEVGGGIIDAPYRGALGVALTNHGQAQWVAGRDTAIAQLLVVPCLLMTPMVVDSLGATDRGDKGFGSSDAREASDFATGTGHSRHLNGHQKNSGEQE